MIRILLVDDSVTQREILKRILADDAEITIIAEARNGKEAVELTQQLLPDVVLMDIHMPEMDGIQAAIQIMEKCPTPIVIMSATLQKYDIDMGLEALNAGACAVIEKPQGAVLLHLEKMVPEVRHEILAASKACVRPLRDQKKPLSSVPLKITRNVEAVGICVSTGGPSLLETIFSQVPTPSSVPILLVQHIPGGFAEGFVKWISKKTGHSFQLANEGQLIQPGVWMGVPGQHLTIDKHRRIRLMPRESKDIHCPSGNQLFQSMAKQMGANAVGIVLTGMGDDGAAGLLDLYNAGADTIIQHQDDCLIWGMPKAAQNLEAARQELTPVEIVRYLSRLTRVAE